MRRSLATLLSITALVVVVSVQAQSLELGPTVAEEGANATPEELRAWQLVRAGQFIKGREAAERVLKRNPRSYVAHFLRGYALHYAEGDFPRALYHQRQALALFEHAHGQKPPTSAPWRWHARILGEIASTEGDLEHHEEKLRYMLRYNELYDPDMLAEKAWPLMKMRRFHEARLAAREGMSSEDPRQKEIALNAFCAIEFEAGNDGVSYEACKAAVDYARQREAVNAVDLTNFAEAARSLFRLDEAERVLQEATHAEPAWYGNPWIELAELYTREARYLEALNALRNIVPYQAQRPPHVRDADRNEARRAVAAFFLVIGRPYDAIRSTEKALVAPDRRAHNSRDPAQDLALSALLDRRARLVAAERKLEEASAKPFTDRVVAWFESTWLRAQAWLSGRRAARMLADDKRLVGMFRIGTADSGILPPWFAGELTDVAGNGVVREAVRRARTKDRRPLAGAYYDAFDAEACLGAGDETCALARAERSLKGLSRGESLLRARVFAIAAEGLRRADRMADALRFYEGALETDPGVFRRLGFELPVRTQVDDTEVSLAAADAFARSPRFTEVADAGLVLRIDVDARRARACLFGGGGSSLACSDVPSRRGESVEGLAQRLVDAFHEQVFAPRIELTQADANSLDGSNRVSRDPLRSFFETDGLQ